MVICVPLRIAAVTVVGLLGAASPAAAGVMSPISSDRFVSVTNRENLPATTVSASGPAMGSWQSTAYKANLSSADQNINFDGSALAVTSTQQSDITSNGITFNGFVFIDYVAVVPPNLGGAATNRCYAEFHIAAPCDYTLGTTISSNNVSETQGTVALFQSGSPLFTQTMSGNRSGTLPVGDYELRILISGNSGGSIAFDGRTQIDAVFSVPAPTSALSFTLPGFALARRRRPRAA
jgi:hypothetical protein